MPASLTTCHGQASIPDRPAPPVPEGLSYSLTLPAAPQSPGIARAATRTILRAHGLEGITEASVQVMSELVT